MGRKPILSNAVGEESGARFMTQDMTQDSREILKTKVLLAEDSEDDAFFFRFALEKSGVPCEFAHVADGRQAIDYLRASQRGRNGTRNVPDLIFLDLKMPVLTGFEVLKWISQQSFNPPLWVAVLSGSDLASDVRVANELGASEYLVKPLGLEDLKKRLIAVKKNNPGESHRECLSKREGTAAQ
jgi:CheY-like chemotaxis protein